jgi:hypothetical protein
MLRAKGNAKARRDAQVNSRQEKAQAETLRHWPAHF